MSLKRFKLDYKLDGWPIADEESKTVLSSKDSVQILNHLNEENAEMKALLKEASDYLDTNNLTSIGHDSILHKKFKYLTS